MEYLNGWRVSLNTMENCGMQSQNSSKNKLMLFCKLFPSYTYSQDTEKLLQTLVVFTDFQGKAELHPKSM